MSEFLTTLLFILWILCWTLGGYWLVHAAFKLNSSENGVVGFVVGLTAEIGIANFVARFSSLSLATWLSAIIVFLIGFLIAFKGGGLSSLKIKIVPAQLIAFLIITYIFFLISRGLAIYDDYAHLPTISIMATGQIPPKFAFDPQVSYGYHYFLLLLAAQVMRLTGYYPWTAWDLARTLSIAPAVILGGLWAYRVTHNKIAGILGSLGVIFFSGTRWLLLLLPNSILSKLSSHILLIGAGGDAGGTLIRSLGNPWIVDGQGSFPFPFSFLNGIFVSGAEAVHMPIGLMVVAIIFALLITGSRWRNSWGILVSVILISSIGLLDEIELPLLALSILILTLIWIVRHKKLKIPNELKKWWIVWVISGAIVAFQGGVWTITLASWVEQLLGHVVPSSYVTIVFNLVAPGFVSGHLGVLSLLDINSLIVALAEIGPILLVLPFLIFWALKSYRAERWYEATLTTAAIISTFLIFIQFSGSTGVRNSSRLYFFIQVCMIMAVSTVWMWASHRPHIIKQLASLICAVTLFGGLVMLGVQFPNIKNQIFSSFITPMDVKMENLYWNKLTKGSLVFDSIPERAATIFGRNTNAGFSWYQMKPEYTNLLNIPDVYEIRKTGFSYAYIDEIYWNTLTPEKKSVFDQACVNLIHEELDKNNNWRRLYDLQKCQ